MHIVETKFKPKYAKTEYHSVLLMQSYRQGKKVKKRTIANLSKCSKEEIAALKLALANKDDLSQLKSLKDVKVKQGLSVGSVWLVYKLAQSLGIEKALGTHRAGKLALWQVCSRVLEQGSRLSSVRLAKIYAIADILNLRQGFTEDDLYKNLAWLSNHQDEIEDKLFAHRHGQKCELFLYDVTSTYLEGQDNELAAFGYNRDKKKGKKQIVIGLLCNESGDPVSVQVFRGNTQDPKTVESQIKKASQRFGCSKITFVGDRGMIKSGQIKDLNQAGFNYITAITKPQIETLLKENVIQMELFTDKLCEVEYQGLRYILRRNPQRAAEIAHTRLDKQDSTRKLLRDRNNYLKQHPKAQINTALTKVQTKINQLKINKWLSVEQYSNQRRLMLKVDQIELDKVSILDGCYIIKTDLTKQAADKHIVHDRYKDLTQVESAFRTFKTSHLEIRPVFVVKQASTRGHVLITMLAYLVTKVIQRAWQRARIDITVQEGLRQLATICSVELNVKDKAACHQIPIPNQETQKLLTALNIRLPKVLAHRKVNVVTRKKLADD